MRTGNKFILILSALLVYVTLLAVPQQAGAAELKKLTFSMKQVYIQTNNSGSLDSIGLRVLAIMDNGLEQDVTDDPQCALTSSKGTIFTVSGQTITAVGKGSAALKAAYGGKTASLSVKVIDTVGQFTLSADNPTMQAGGSLSVKAKLEFNDATLKPLDVSSYCTWTSDDDDIVSVKAGKLKALSLTETGIGIQAECMLLGSSMSKSITVKVINPIKSLKAEPFSLTGATGGTFTNLVIKPVYKDGSYGSSITSSAQFSSTNTRVAKVGNTDSDKGQVSFVAAGRASIKAAYAGKIVSIPVRVNDTGSVTALTSIPDVTELQIVAGSSSSIKFKDNNGVYVTSYVDLSSSDETIATTAPGKITALSPGVANIKCAYGGQEITIKVTVIKKVSSLSVSPTSINIAADQTAQILLTATYSDKTTGQVTESGTYSSGSDSIAEVNATGLVTGKSAGSTKITASFGGKTVTVPVNVIGANFSDITFSTSSTSGGPIPPADINDITYNLATGNSLKVYARALFSGSHSTPDITDITGKCAWTSDDTSVATVSSGTVTAKKAGATRITATYGNRSNSFTVNVWPTISSITATPNTLGFFGTSVPSKDITSIIAKFSDGSERDLLPSEINWASKDENMVTVSNGTVTLVTSPSLKTGSTTVTGTLAGKTFTVDVSVSPEITGFSLSTGSITLITGTAATFNVTAQYLGSTYSDVTKNCDYTVKDGSGTVTPEVTVDKDKGTITAQTGAPVSGTIEVTLQGTTKSMNYTVIPKPTALGMELVPDEGTAFSQDNLVDNKGTFYFNIANQSKTFNLYVHSTAAPTADSSRISGDSLLSVFSSNNSVATVNWDSGDSAYKLARVGADGSTAVITAYFLDKSFKLTVGVDLVKPAKPEESGTSIEGSTQSKNFNIIVTAEAGSSVTATVLGSNVLSGTATSVTATSAGTATLTIDMSKLPVLDGPYDIDIIATDPAGNPSDTYPLNIFKDTTEPVITSVTATQVNGGGDTIVVQFDEDLANGSGQATNRANWTIQYADNLSDDNITAIVTTNADFTYDDGLDTLTIKLDETIDQASIPSGKLVKVTPNSTNISDEYGNNGMAAAYTATTVPDTDNTGPAVEAPGWATTANPNEFTVTYNEVLDRDTVIKENWTFTDANSGGTVISSVALAADGKTVTVTLSGAIETGDNIITTPNVKDLAGEAVVDTGYTVP